MNLQNKTNKKSKITNEIFLVLIVFIGLVKICRFNQPLLRRACLHNYEPAAFVKSCVCIVASILLCLNISTDKVSPYNHN